MPVACPRCGGGQQRCYRRRNGCVCSQLHGLATRHFGAHAVHNIISAYFADNSFTANATAFSACIGSLRPPRTKSRVPPPFPGNWASTCFSTAFISLFAEGCCAKIKWPEADLPSSPTVFSDLASWVAKWPKYSGGVLSLNTRAITRTPWAFGSTDRKANAASASANRSDRARTLLKCASRSLTARCTAAG